MNSKVVSSSGIYIGFLARVDIQKGQLLRRVWLRWVRPAKDAFDGNVVGVALANAKKGEEVPVAVNGTAPTILKDINKMKSKSNGRCLI